MSNVLDLSGSSLGRHLLCSSAQHEDCRYVMGLVVADIPQVSSQLEQKEMAAASSWVAASLSCQSVDDVGILRSLIGVVSVFIGVERYRGF